MHPAYKTQYFYDNDWEPAWVATATQMARDVWRKYYKPSVTVKAPVPRKPRNDSDHESDDDFNNVGRKKQPTGEGQDSFEKYINEAVDEDFDPKELVNYWTAYLPSAKSTVITPKNALARMALDFLAAPATSTEVERLFSHGGLVVTKRRHNLTAKSVRERMILQNRFGIEGLVPRKSITKHLNGKSSKGEEEDDEEEEMDLGEFLDEKKMGYETDTEMGENDIPENEENDDDDEEEEADVVILCCIRN